jgi:hypothetical protein
MMMIMMLGKRDEMLGKRDEMLGKRDEMLGYWDNILEIKERHCLAKISCSPK